MHHTTRRLRPPPRSSDVSGNKFGFSSSLQPSRHELIRFKVIVISRAGAHHPCLVIPASARSLRAGS
eukprot:6380746-Pyramimonas_sp.AAC.1